MLSYAGYSGLLEGASCVIGGIVDAADIGPTTSVLFLG